MFEDSQKYFGSFSFLKKSLKYVGRKELETKTVYCFVRSYDGEREIVIETVKEIVSEIVRER